MASIISSSLLISVIQPVYPFAILPSFFCFQLSFSPYFLSYMYVLPSPFTIFLLSIHSASLLSFVLPIPHFIILSSLVIALRFPLMDMDVAMREHFHPLDFENVLIPIIIIDFSNKRL